MRPDAVVYQVYPRSFQDGDGDGLGDLRGLTARLDHLVDLGVDALWLSPVNPSPDHDLGYDVTDHEDVDPRLGTVEDAERLVAEAHARGLAVLLDLVPCHTSIEHPWFTAHPERYVLRGGADRPNNWRSAFGGPAWSRDPHGRGWYLHSFYPEQPDLDWRNPEVPGLVGRALRTWLDRGVDGFRLDALDRLLKDPALRDDPPATGPAPLPVPPDLGRLDRRHSIDAPDIGVALAAIRAAAGDATLVGEVYLPTARLGPYLEHLDHAFCFELLHAPWQAPALRAAIGAALGHHPRPGAMAWVLSNHDFPRLPTRVGARVARLASLLLLTLPGVVFLFQGDELELPDGPGGDPPVDRFGRDAHRHPMPWDDGPALGFSTGRPWLPAVRPPSGTVAEQARDPRSPLAFHRRLVALRRELGEGFAFLPPDETAPDVLAFRRGEHLVALNLAGEPRPVPAHGEVRLATREDAVPRPGVLAPHAGFVAAAS